jgi:hypothetical protein
LRNYKEQLADRRNESHDAVTVTLQGYADRGVFRGFRASPAARGRTTYEFKWLSRKPVTAVFDARRRKLLFPILLPSIEGAAADDVETLIASRSSRQVPEHKRLDARRARVITITRKGDLTLALEIRGNNHEYAVKRALNLINDVFLVLHESHPEYLVTQFGISAE